MDKEKDYYLEILKAFEEAISQIDDDTDIFHVIEVLSEIRAKYLFQIVADNMLLSYTYALNIVRDNIDRAKSDITDQRALVLVSAMENLLEFAVYEEYTMFTKMPEELELPDEDESNETIDVFERFNLLYAGVENETVGHSALIALAFTMLPSNRMIEYVTQRDERVRYTHALLDGTMYPKDDFPDELIPPIDYNCRCLLVDTGIPVGMNAKVVFAKERPAVNPIFKESLAKGGRIFGKDHSYFNVENENHIDKLNTIISKISERWLKV